MTFFKHYNYHFHFQLEKIWYTLQHLLMVKKRGVLSKGFTTVPIKIIHFFIYMYG